MMDALTILNQLADNVKRTKYANVPPHALVKSKYNDNDANSLTRCVVAWFSLNGHFPIRLQSTGTYQADRQKFVGSQQRAVLAVVNGRAVCVEVKYGTDRPSNAQKQTMLALQASGALVYVARNFEGFYAWYERNVPTSTALPDIAGPAPHPIPWLATPDLTYQK